MKGRIRPGPGPGRGRATVVPRSLSPSSAFFFLLIIVSLSVCLSSETSAAAGSGLNLGSGVEPPESLFHKCFLDLPLEDLTRTRQNLVDAFGVRKHYVERTSLDGPCSSSYSSSSGASALLGKSLGELDSTKRESFVTEVKITDKGSIDSLAELVARAFDGKGVETFQDENSAEVKNLIADLLQKEDFVKMISTTDDTKTETEAVLNSAQGPAGEEEVRVHRRDEPVSGKVENDIASSSSSPGEAETASKAESSALEQETQGGNKAEGKMEAQDDDEDDDDGADIRYVIDDDESEYEGDFQKQLEQARKELVDAFPKEYQEAVEELRAELFPPKKSKQSGQGDHHESVFIQTLLEMNGAERHQLYTSQGFDGEAIEIFEEMLKAHRYGDRRQLQEQLEKQKELLLQQVNNMQYMDTNQLKRDLEWSKEQLKVMFPELFKNEEEE